MVGIAGLACFAAQADETTVPGDFPQFIVPGHEREMASLRSLFWQHYQSAHPLVPMWDEWLPNAMLWPARGEGAKLAAMRASWATALASRRMNAEGYIETQQHDGPAHAEGWPFPTWMQAGGIGWHFRPIGVAGYEAPLTTSEGWKLKGALGGDVNDRGLAIELMERAATVQSPAFAMDAARAPWLRLNWWANGLGDAKCYIEWTTVEAPDFSPDRRVEFTPAASGNFESSETRTMIRMYRHAGWKGTITGLRIGFDNPSQGRVVVKSFHTASDTRHNVNNLNFIRGCYDYFLWSRDIEFLRGQIARIRTAMRFVEHEFQTREKKCIYTTWPGHEGTSGVRWVNGVKSVLPGVGVGSNYWDLLPFGGYDALATVYYYDTLLDLAALEELIATHPEWQVKQDRAYDPVDLRRHAADVKSAFGERFWSPVTGRFGTVDLDNNLHDYGFTFLNNEAVVFGLATPEQSETIHSWINGSRTVAGDTSVSAGIYHWRFGPRSTTLRNIDYYFWGWSNPETVPWGYQVQDGGAVLGWSYYDLMARLKTAGPDNAAARLNEIARWFDDTQTEGGYRSYYGKDVARGSLQGGGTAGGLGLDHEFYESVLMPQVMLYGFLGFLPTADGFAIDPHLPTNWPELTITRIHLHNHVLDITATRDGAIKISGTGPTDYVLTIMAPPNLRLESVRGVTARLENRKKGAIAINKPG
jgi:hypothetical protein